MGSYQSRVVDVNGYSAVSLTQDEITSSFLEISVISQRTESEVSANYRTPFARTFFGYYQLAYGSVMWPAKQLETQFQLVYREVDIMPGILSRFCEMGDYVRYLKGRLDTALAVALADPPTVYFPLATVSFPNYQRGLPHLHPSSCLVRADFGVEVKVLITHQMAPFSDCELIPDCSFEPLGCWDSGTNPFTVDPSCQPSGPSGGGVST